MSEEGREGGRGEEERREGENEGYLLVFKIEAWRIKNQRL